MKAVLWDLDDTLLNTLPARMRALKHAYETTIGGWVDPEALWRSHRGGTLEAMGDRLLGEEGWKFVAAYRDRYYHDAHRAIAFDGIGDVLETLRAHGLQLAVVTSKIWYGAIEELDQTGLLRHFAAVVCCDDVESPKPDPAPVYEAMARIFVDRPEDVLMVGDSPADMFAARNAGVRGVAATWATLDREMLLDCAPAFVAASPAEVLAIVASAVSSLEAAR